MASRKNFRGTSASEWNEQCSGSAIISQGAYRCGHLIMAEEKYIIPGSRPNDRERLPEGIYEES